MRFLFYTDGSCDNAKTKRGGWAYLLYLPDKRWEVAYGWAHNTSSSVMETTAILRALQRSALEPNLGSVLIRSDSTYCIDSATDYVFRWARNNWRGSSGPISPTLRPLWEQIRTLLLRLSNVKFEHVRAHRHNPRNNYVDAVANKARLLSEIVPVEASNFVLCTGRFPDELHK